MPHGGYHGTVVMGGNIIQQGKQDNQGNYQIEGGIGDAALNIPYNQQAQTAAEATAAVEAKKKEIRDKFPLTLENPTQYPATGLNLSDQPVTQTVPPSMGFTQTVNPFGADDVRALAMDFDRENQILNDLLIAEQQAKNREGIIRAAQQGVLNKSDLTGYEDDGLFGTTIGATPSTGISGISTVFNPFTKEPLGGTTGVVGENLATQIKAREGLTTPQYNQFISDLYDANPQLYQETFPFASGQIAKPIFAKALEATQAVGSGIAGLPGVKELGQMGGDIVGAMISPLSGLFTGETAKTGFVNPKAPTGGGDVSFLRDIEERFKPSDRKLPYIHSGEIPAEYLDGFTKFYQNYEGPIVGGAAITPVTLPDGSVIEFGDTGSARVFREYLESIGATQPEKPSGIDAIIPQKKIQPFDIRQFYASLPQYTQQGIMNPNLMSYYQNLGMFPGMAV